MYGVAKTMSLSFCVFLYVFVLLCVCHQPLSSHLSLHSRKCSRVAFFHHNYLSSWIRPFVFESRGPFQVRLRSMSCLDDLCKYQVCSDSVWAYKRAMRFDKLWCNVTYKSGPSSLLIEGLKMTWRQPPPIDIGAELYWLQITIGNCFMRFECNSQLFFIKLVKIKFWNHLLGYYDHDYLINIAKPSKGWRQWGGQS